MENPCTGIFNCGTGEERSFEDLAGICRALVNKGRIEHVPFPQDLRGKYQTYTRADLTALRHAGYHASFLDLEAGLARYAQVVAASNGYYRS
jgi:ADP-L-glycero-D-manno-heptose 6-epimerase